jgi:hypothetical protein
VWSHCSRTRVVSGWLRRWLRPMIQRSVHGATHGLAACAVVAVAALPRAWRGGKFAA